MNKNAMTAFLNWPQLKKLWVFIGVLVIESREILLYYCIFCPGLGRWSKISTVLSKKATGQPTNSWGSYNIWRCYNI